jgi:maleylacetoacetate isomerase/maleylpyruvate isomerase
VRIALEIKGIPYTYKPVHLLNNGGEQNSETYRKINPAGGVPTLIHGAIAIAQSFAIIEYLDRKFPQHPLFSDDPAAAAKIRQFCETVNSDIHPLTNLKVMKVLEEKYNFSPVQKQDWITKWVGDGLEALEKLLLPVAGKYSFGEQVTAADVFLIPQLFSAKRFNVEYAHLKTLNRINENCLLRPEFLKAHPYRQPDTPAELRLPDQA